MTEKPDNIVKIGFQSKANNDVILARINGTESFTVTPLLRWNNGVLEQLHKGNTTGTTRWEPVPQACDLPF